MWPHAICINNPWVLAAHIFGNSAIVLAYISIPLSLLVLAQRMGVVPHVPFEAKLARYQDWLGAQAAAPTARAALLWSSAFVFSCAGTHVWDLVVLFVPTYRAQAIALLACGAISLVSSAKIAAFVEAVAPPDGSE